MKKLSLKIGILLIMVLAICTSCIQAATNYTKFGISPQVTDSTGTYVYAFQSSSQEANSLKYIWNIKPYSNETPITTNEVFYCLAHGYGDFTDFNSTATVGQAPTTSGGVSQSTYSGPFNLKDSSENGDLYRLRNVFYGGKSNVTAFKEETIHGLVWLLDNMYIPTEDDKTTFLGKIPCTNYGEFNQNSGTIKDLIEELEVSGTTGEISDLDIEVAQQLAIWKLTNPELFQNSLGDPIGIPTIYLSKNNGVLQTYDQTFAQDIEDVDQSEGNLRDYCVKMIYKYLVEGAKQAQNTNYAINTNATTRILVYANAEAQPIVTVTREKQLTGQYNILMKKVNTAGKVLQEAEFSVNGATYTTGSDGTVNVTPGGIQITEQNKDTSDSYTIVETKAPIGYIKYDGTITLTVTKKVSSDGLRYEINTATLDGTSTSSGKVTIDKNTNTITITVKDEEEPTEERIDLALRKFISKVVDLNGVTVYSPEQLANRKPTPDTTRLQNRTATTADYNHTKQPVQVSIGDKVTYTLRIYNEGNVDAYITQVTDYLSKYLKYVANEENEQWLREYGITGTDTYESKATSTTLTVITGASDNLSTLVGKTMGDGILLPAYDAVNDKLSYIDVQLVCEVLEPNIEDGIIEDYKITNIAEITGKADKNKTPITELDVKRDSTPNNVKPNLPTTEQAWQEYKDSEIGQKNYIPGNEDDDDFEKVKIVIPKYDLALRKFIVEVGTRRLKDENGKYTREPVVDTTSLKQGIAEQGYGTATYNHPKGSVTVGRGNTVTYVLRVYNEGNIDAYASEITDHLPEYLEFLKDDELNKKFGWSYDENTREVKTTITSKTTADPTGIYSSRTNGKLISAYAGGATLDYIDVAIRCKISDKANIGDIQTNIAEITGITDTKGNEIEEDMDSVPDGNLVIPSKDELPKYKEELEKNPFVPGQEDDDDYEKVKVIGNFDLALRKFITKVNTAEVNTRYPQVSLDNSGRIKYTHPKNPVEVCTGDIVTYTIRVYNEGEIDGYANEITDDVPFGLEFVVDNEINKKYGWKMLDENQQETTDISKAKYLVTDYLSEAQGKATGRDNLIKAFNKSAEITDKNPDYRDVEIAFRVTYQVKAVGEESKVLVNVAQISEDSNEDVDSVPKRDEVYNEENHEDDIDYEDVKVKYFDLSLLKWVTRAVVVENGETTIIESGHTGYENPEPDLKVELKTKDVKKVIVKFAYTIKITNEGQIAGYAKEITDYIPQGLEFRQEDNLDWYIRADGKVATSQLEDVLLQPGDSAEVEIILTWINGEKNLGRKVNVAEISKDDNPSNTPDIDSTPDNEVPDEDDIDDAPVLIVIKTGTDVEMQYIGLATTVIAILGTGIIAIKKFVLV